ncbi:MAG: hypothetical protein ACOYEV_04265 [Candidatus Nanopelagicales bacterium]
MSVYSTAELRQRQEQGTAGFTPAPYSEQKRDALVLALMLIVGLLVAYASPLPGLGAFIAGGALMATPVLALHIWLGG